ncbi:MAG: tRNA guanosine(15) transglycosylase TgtA [Desulfurococcaceae archaeon]
MEYYDPREYDLAGRIAKLKTKHGFIETPFLFPVIDPSRQNRYLNIIDRVGFNAFITNAYLLYRRNRGERVNIHDFFDWRKPVMTDSGGYQILIYGSVDVDNKTIVKYQKEIDSDICVILDIPTGTSMSRVEALNAIRETIKRSWESMSLIMESDQLWVLPIQGAPYPDLVYYSSLVSSRIPYHIYALGSPTVYLEKYDYEKILLLTIIARRNLPPNKPLHVFGVGHPMIIPFLVAVGADLFDSASYILYARDDRLMFEWGTRRLDELYYSPCNCPICSKYSIEELREMNRDERVDLIAEHNLYVLMKEIKQTKQTIREGRLWEYLEYKSKLHSSLKKAFGIIVKYRDYLMKYNPLIKTNIHALLLIDSNSVCNPRLEINRKNTYKYLIKGEYSKLLLLPALSKPYSNDRIYNMFREKYCEFKILFYHPYLGLFPPEVSNTYPYFQHEIGRLEYSSRIVREIINTITKLRVSDLKIVTVNNSIYRKISERIYIELKNIVKNIEIIRA